LTFWSFVKPALWKARFRLEAIQNERERLIQNQNFELPYGQAWLLLLLNELEKTSFQSKEVHSFRTELVERIGLWLEKNEFPEHKVNSYHSWLITYFLFKKSKSDAHYSRINIIDEKFNSVVNVYDENDPKDFFSPESLFQILKHQPKKAFNLVQSLNQLGPINHSNCHHLGKIISKIWTTPKNQIDALESVIQSIKEVTKRPELWKSDFDTVAHWIPQFLWFGLFLALDEP